MAGEIIYSYFFQELVDGYNRERRTNRSTDLVLIEDDNNWV